MAPSDVAFNLIFLAAFPNTYENFINWDKLHPFKCSTLPAPKRSVFLAHEVKSICSVSLYFMKDIPWTCNIYIVYMKGVTLHVQYLQFASAWATEKDKYWLTVLNRYRAQQVNHQGDSRQTAEGGKPSWHFHSIKLPATVACSSGLAGKQVISIGDSILSSRWVNWQRM